jgi:hypothetical protein
MPDEQTVIREILGYDPSSIDRALSRSLIDSDYRQRLLEDAKAAFAEEGVNFPDGVSVTCHEVDLDDRHFFLPPMVSDPQPVDIVAAGEAAANRPDFAPPDPPVEGGVRPGLARPFVLGTSYPGPAAAADEPDQRYKPDQRD